MNRRQYLVSTGAVATMGVAAGCTDAENGDGDDGTMTDTPDEDTNGNGDDANGETEEPNGDGDGDDTENGGTDRDEDDRDPEDLPETGDGEGVLELGISAGESGVLSDFSRVIVGSERMMTMYDGEEVVHQFDDILGEDLTLSDGPDDALIFEQLVVDAGTYSNLRIDIHPAPGELEESGEQVEFEYPDGEMFEFDNEVTVEEGWYGQLVGPLVVVETDGGGYRIEPA